MKYKIIQVYMSNQNKKISPFQNFYLSLNNLLWIIAFNAHSIVGSYIEDNAIIIFMVEKVN